ncbi:UDP-N-acetylmuramoyl-L-alanine--D-glutamate ligase [Rickettsiales bacterium LUAb2]
MQTPSNNIINVNHKKAALLGIGRSTLSAYNFLLKQGFELVIWDDNPAVRNKYANQQLNIVDCKNWDYQQLDFVVSSPGIALFFPNKHLIVNACEQHKVNILCDIELFQYYFPNSQYIGITGSNGKSTTVSLIAHIFEKANKNFALAGNIGIPIFELANEPIKDYYILELSSFQISLFNKVRLNIAGILNISPNHDDYHGGYDNYQSAKLAIFNNQLPEDYALVNIKDDYIDHIQLNKLNSKVIRLAVNQDEENNKLKTKEVANISINQQVLNNTLNENSTIDLATIINNRSKEYSLLVLFSYAVCSLSNIDDQTFIKGLQSFKGLAHRQYLVAKHHNIIFINDSKATTPLAAKAALSSFSNIYWLLGGIKKSGNLEVILPLLSKLKKVYIFGKSRLEFAQELEGKVPVEVFLSLKEAVQKAYADAKVDRLNATILLSPVGTSFDEFNNFEERGNYFIELVKELTNVTI